MQVYFVGTSAPQIEFNLGWVSETRVGRLPPNVFQGFAIDGTGASSGRAFGRLTEPVAEFWFSFYISILTGGGNISDSPFVEFFDVNNVPILRLGKNTNSEIILEYYSGSSWSSVGDYEPLSLDVLIKIDIHAKLDSVDGIFELFINEESVGSFTGNTIFTDSEEFTYFGFTRFGTSSLINGRVTYSSVMCLDETTIGRRLANRRPTGQGFYDEWEGNYEDLAGTGYNPDVSVVGELNQKTSYTSTPLTDVDTYVVEAIIHTTNARRQNLNGGRLQTFVRYGGADYEAEPQEISLSYALTYSIMFENPVTELPWEVEDLSTSEMGMTALPPL